MLPAAGVDKTVWVSPCACNELMQLDCGVDFAPMASQIQSQIQDFPKEGARFRVMKCHVDAIQWGGVVAECFRDLQNPMRFSGGGGG